MRIVCCEGVLPFVEPLHRLRLRARSKVGMLSLRKPSADALRRFLAAQRELPFTYETVGATAGTPPAGYVVDRTRIKLGEGEPVFRSAIAALRRWEQFDLGWVEAWPSDTPLRSGEVVAVMGRAIGVWWLNACRVVDEAGPTSKFGSPTARCPATSRAARSGSWWSGTGATTPCGTTSLPFHALTSPRHDSAIQSCAACKKGLGGTRRRRW